MKQIKKMIVSTILLGLLALMMCCSVSAKVLYETRPGKYVLKGSVFTISMSTWQWRNVKNKIIEGDVEDSSVVEYTGPILKTMCPLYMEYGVRPAMGHFHITGKTGSKNKTVVQCKLKAKKVGTSYVTFTLPNRANGIVSDRVMQMPIYVVQGVTKLQLNRTSAIVKRGKTISLKTTVYPKNAYNKKVGYISSNRSVATVTTNGIVTAKKKGTAIITAKALDGSGKTVTCKITVK